MMHNIKPGDELLISEGGNERPAACVRCTETQIITDTLRFSRKTGRMIGASKLSRYRARVAPRIIGLKTVINEQRRRAPLVDRLQATHWSTWQRLSTSQLQRIVDILDEGVGK